jgi:hypothetical protein
VGIDPNEQRTRDPGAYPVITDGLTDRQNMPLVESAVERRPAVPGCAERNALRADRWIGLAREIGRHQPRHIDERRRINRLASERAYFRSHVVSIKIQRSAASTSSGSGGMRPSEQDARLMYHAGHPQP